MKLILSLFCLFSFTRHLAQIQIDTTTFFETSKIGTVKQVSSEEVCAIVVFVSGQDSDWKANKKKKVLNRDKRAFKAFKNELKRYNVDFKIHFELFNVKEDFKIDSVIDHKQPFKDWMSLSGNYKKANAIKIWDYYTTSNLTFFENEQYKSYEGGYFLIIYHEGLGVNTAAPDFFNKKTETIELPEYITIYEYDINRHEHRKRTTVHEILHLFGAWDLYNEPFYGMEEATYNLLKSKYPKSIMRDSKEITIDPLTAWRIGINNNPEPWFLEIIPRSYLRLE
jgi:hypothetical protein